MAMTLDFALTKAGRLKVGELSLPSISGRFLPPSSPSETSVSLSSKGTPANPLVPSWLVDTLEVCLTLRGLGWQFGNNVKVPVEYRPLQRTAFLRANLLCFLKNYLLLDFCMASYKLFPGVGSPSGGSIFYDSLPFFYRYGLSLALTAFAGFTLISCFEFLNATVTLIGVGLFHQSPFQWPPVVDNPWAADSLHNLWAKRWHQSLRRTFLVFGGIPGSWIAGQPGLVLGAFLASGLYHEGGACLLGQGIDHLVILFFVLQGVGVLLERL